MPGVSATVHRNRDTNFPCATREISFVGVWCEVSFGVVVACAASVSVRQIVILRSPTEPPSFHGTSKARQRLFSTNPASPCRVANKRVSAPHANHFGTQRGRCPLPAGRT